MRENPLYIDLIEKLFFCKTSAKKVKKKLRKGDEIKNLAREKFEGNKT